MNAIATIPQNAAGIPDLPSQVSVGALESALAMGDLRKLSPGDRLNMLGAITKSMGLNPLTQPFQFIELDGKLTLYATKGCAEQLRSIRRVSVRIVERVVDEGVLVVRAQATDAHGREDEATGAVSVIYPEYRWSKVKNGWEKHPQAGQKFTGQDLANAMMKAETKAKRRVTLSICGLGCIDESELPHAEIVEGGTSRLRQGSDPAQLGVGQTAADRAHRLNASLTAGQKSRSVDVETLPAKPNAAGIPAVGSSSKEQRQSAAPQGTDERGEPIAQDAGARVVSPGSLPDTDPEDEDEKFPDEPPEDKPTTPPPPAGKPDGAFNFDEPKQPPKQDRSKVEAFLKLIEKCVPAALTYLRKINWIPADGGFEDLAEERIEKIMARPDAFLRQVESSKTAK